MAQGCRAQQYPNLQVKWFYQEDGRVIGPLSETALRELHQCGTLSSTTLIRREDSEGWVRLDVLLDPECDTLSSPGRSPEPELRKFHCIHCGQKVAIEASQAGMTVRCPACSGDILLPGEPVEPTPPVPVGLSVMESAHTDANKFRDIWVKLDAPASAFSTWSAAPIFISCLVFGWISTWILPVRAFSPDLTPASLVGVATLAVPAVAIAFLGMVGGKGANQALAAARAGGDVTLKAAYDAARASQRAALAVPLLHRPASLNCKACLPALVTKVCSLSTGKRAQSRVISYRVKVVLYH